MIVKLNDYGGSTIYNDVTRVEFVETHDREQPAFVHIYVSGIKYRSYKTSQFYKLTVYGEGMEVEVIEGCLEWEPQYPEPQMQGGN